MGSTQFARMSIILFIILCMNTKAYVQRVVINQSGEQIILYPDGTWRKPEAGDSILLKQYGTQQQVASSSIGQQGSSQKRNKAEEYDYLLRQWNGLYLDLLAEEKEVQDKFRVATNAQFKAAELLQNAETNKKLIEPDRLVSLQEEYEMSVSNLRAAKLQQKEIKSLVDKGNKINARPESISQGKINKIKTQFTIYLSRHQKMVKPALPPAKPNADTQVSNPGSKVMAAKPVPSAHPAPAEPFDPKMVDKRPPGLEAAKYVSQPYPCVFDTDTLDMTTRVSRLELHPEVLFTYTDPDLRPFFKTKDLITCRARVSKIGPYTYLSVEFQIASSHSQSNFGTLDEGSLLRFRLMNGEYVSLYNLKAHAGRIDPYSGNTIFTGQYALGKSELKKLKVSELDQMRVLWSTGYEDYDIYQVDLLIDQINCLNAKE